MPIEIDTEMLTPAKCPDGCVQGIGYDHDEPYFCACCDGTSLVWMDPRYASQFTADGRRAA